MLCHPQVFATLGMVWNSGPVTLIAISSKSSYLGKRMVLTDNRAHAFQTHPHMVHIFSLTLGLTPNLSLVPGRQLLSLIHPRPERGRCSFVSTNMQILSTGEPPRLVLVNQQAPDERQSQGGKLFIQGSLSTPIWLLVQGMNGSCDAAIRIGEYSHEKKPANRGPVKQIQLQFCVMIQCTIHLFLYSSSTFFYCVSLWPAHVPSVFTVHCNHFCFHNPFGLSITICVDVMSILML